MNKPLLFLFFILIFFFSKFSYSFIEKDSSKSFFKNILTEDEHTQNRFFSAGYQYMLNPIGKTIGAQGTIANYGLNIAKLFSKKIVLGFTVDIKLIPGISTKKPKGDFVTDFNTQFINTYSNKLDSVNAYVTKSAINGNNGYFITGNTNVYFGIMFSPFPQKYGGLMLQIKYGSTSYYVHGVFGNKYFNNGGNDKIPFSTISNWIYEINIKPLAFIENTYVKQGTLGIENIMNYFVVSLYYERLNFKSFEFNGSTLDKIVKPDFTNKYGIDNRFGIKFGLLIY